MRLQCTIIQYININSFNSRTLGRVRLYVVINGKDNITVSIHAPWEGCDKTSPSTTRTRLSFNSRTLGRVRQARLDDGRAKLEFQFTHPGKGATLIRSFIALSACVSIHAPWEGCDFSRSSCSFLTECFNSRTLGRVRPQPRDRASQGPEVSIHAPWEGCD